MSILSKSLILVFLSLPCSAAIAFVQSKSVDGSASLAFTSNATQSSLMVLCLRVGGATGITPTATDTIGNTWSSAIQADATDGGTDHYTLLYVKSNASSAADTVTVANTGGGSIRFSIAEYTGLDGTSPLDRTANASSGADSGTPNSGNISSPTSVASELLIGCLTTGGSASNDTFTAGTSSAYTVRERQAPAGGLLKTALQDATVSSVGTYQADGTINNAQPWTMGIATFKAATGAAATVCPSMGFLGVGCGI